MGPQRPVDTRERLQFADLNILGCEPKQLRAGTLRAIDVPDPSGRITIWEPPRPGRTYVAGADFALGVGRDWDTICVLDKSCEQEGSPPRQVAEAQGQWGPKFWAVLYAVLTHYNGAFLLGEQQGGGVHAMRWLWDYCDYRWIYRRGDPAKSIPVATEANPALGWPRTANDVVLTAFRMAVRDRRVVLRSVPLLQQMAGLRFKARANEDELARDPDDRLRLSVQGGGSPDLVMAAAYASYALSQVFLFEKPVELPGPGTYGHDLGLNKFLPEAQRAQPTFVRVA